MNMGEDEFMTDIPFIQNFKNPKDLFQSFGLPTDPTKISSLDSNDNIGINKDKFSSSVKKFSNEIVLNKKKI